MNAPNISRRATRPIRPEAATHLYAVGQAVRLTGGFTERSKIAGVYHITGTLPPRGDFPQYRIRNDDELYERVTTQDNLQPVSASSDGEGATLIERTFRHGQGAEARPSRD
ncbi:hypothetical protein K9U39_07270 [Rhodoblastus acidophilus]|uniref:Uncharacterized protein n=1 Tax=Candidatus Rhodoblastus alkanivorans TaxID=2954117 RepID=A0ABS9Z723_9HYPH|nr:hypothetical protein [Candidatus Rhodoblastus alkanivorans]MCI4679609.1 hypothetical protein [Candidatus Rhodoblastus alkanivorans]MCI4683434.1 hypothetical protein [Candidatus Rhodoblastus alkanivorans]MDI4640744.1 hypothetical protein [Rhodoblastus acidophilus]